MRIFPIEIPIETYMLESKMLPSFVGAAISRPQRNASKKRRKSQAIP